MDFVLIMLREILFEKICCCSGDTFGGCRNFFRLIGEIFVDFVEIVRKHFF